ncbi:hypothetical protein [Streptomyces malaysiensis]
MPLDPMHKRGTRDELIADLRDSAEGWHHLCKDALSAAAADAADGLEAGSFSVKVGHTIYTVTDAEEKPTYSPNGGRESRDASHT